MPVVCGSFLLDPSTPEVEIDHVIAGQAAVMFWTTSQEVENEDGAVDGTLVALIIGVASIDGYQQSVGNSCAVSSSFSRFYDNTDSNHFAGGAIGGILIDSWEPCGWVFDVSGYPGGPITIGYLLFTGETMEARAFEYDLDSGGGSQNVPHGLSAAPLAVMNVGGNSATSDGNQWSVGCCDGDLNQWGVSAWIEHIGHAIVLGPGINAWSRGMAIDGSMLCQVTADANGGDPGSIYWQATVDGLDATNISLSIDDAPPGDQKQLCIAVYDSDPAAFFQAGTSPMDGTPIGVPALPSAIFQAGLQLYGDSDQFGDGVIDGMAFGMGATGSEIPLSSAAYTATLNQGDPQAVWRLQHANNGLFVAAIDDTFLFEHLASVNSWSASEIDINEVDGSPHTVGYLTGSGVEATLCMLSMLPMGGT